MKSILALGILAALATVGAQAQNVQITGFGQMVAGTVSDGTSFPGTGYDSDWDFKDESLFALQLRGELNPQWSATAQIVARGRDDFEPEFAWAYVGWNGGNGWSAKFGRQRMPLYRYSDFLEVGYAFPWIRVPNSVYNMDFRNYDGLGLSYSFGYGDWYNAIQLTTGRFDGTISLSGQAADAKLSSLIGLSAESTYADWLTIRGSYFEADVSIDSPALAPLLTALSGNGFANVASRIDYTDDPGSFWSFGVEANRGNWMVVGEIIGVEIKDTFLADRSEFYVSGGYRFGALMPTIIWGRRDNTPKRDIVTLLPTLTPLAPLRAGVSQVVFSEDLDATYWSYGLRWDVATNVAFKADYTQYTNKTPASADADSLAVGVTFTF